MTLSMARAVLDQVVRADAEEIDLLGEEVRDHRGGGHLDHNADFELFVERDPLRAKLVHAFSQHGLRLLHLVHTRNHGKEHPQGAVDARPQESPKLGLE